MKKILLITLSIICVSTINAQQTADTTLSVKKINFSLGLAFNTFGIPSSKSSFNTANSKKENGQTLQNSFYGKSIGLIVAFSAPISSNISVELGFANLFGITNKYEELYYSNVKEEVSGAANAKTYMLSPRFVFKLNENKKTEYLYTKLGYQIGFSKIKIQENVVTFSPNSPKKDSQFEWQMTGKPVHGPAFSVGYMFKENKSSKSRTYIELEVSSTSMKPVKTELISSSTNGTQTTNNQTENFSTILFKDEITFSEFDENKPRERLAYPLNFSYVGLKFGIVF